MTRSRHERYAFALVLFALGVAILGHGVAATVYADGVTAVTVAFPLVGATLAYRSFLGLLPAASPLSGDGVAAALAAVTAAVVNVSVPIVGATTGLFAAVASLPSYWPALVAGVAGFTTLGVYELLADRVAGRHALAKVVGAGAVAVAVGVLILVAPARPGEFLTPVDAMAGVAGAVLASALFDYASGRSNTSAPAQ
jgi:hypothetical protein